MRHQPSRETTRTAGESIESRGSRKSVPSESTRKQSDVPGIPTNAWSSDSMNVAFSGNESRVGVGGVGDVVEFPWGVLQGRAGRASSGED